MQEIHGLYSTALVYTDLIEPSAAAQIRGLCDQRFTQGCSIRIMPDVHSGAGCVIGFTADLGERVIPNIVGVDIGCGMLTVELGKSPVDFDRLDRLIRTRIPSGFQIHASRVVDFPRLFELHCFSALKNLGRLTCSGATLGGGNHFIEVDVDDDGNHYLVIHTGSRNLGKQVAEYYQRLAVSNLKGREYADRRRRALIDRYKAQGRESELQQALAELQQELADAGGNLPDALCYLTGEDRERYLHDMRICQEFAVLNRQTIAQTIVYGLFHRDLSRFSSFETVHNYIDPESNIIRKGAVSARKGEKLLIPINMRDGSLICLGKGNPDWNYSAPHGAGRLMSRSAARNAFGLDQLRREMEGIYTTSVSVDTIDECPMAYKPMESIVENIRPTAQILRVIRPVYNFKAGREVPTED